MKRKPPPPYRRFARRYPEVLAAYESLKANCQAAGPLKPQLRELVQLGIAIGARLEGAVHAHAKMALEEGATETEVRHVALLATTTLGFSSMMRSLGWIEDVLEGR